MKFDSPLKNYKKNLTHLLIRLSIIQKQETFLTSISVFTKYRVASSGLYSNQIPESLNGLRLMSLKLYSHFILPFRSGNHRTRTRNGPNKLFQIVRSPLPTPYRTINRDTPHICTSLHFSSFYVCRVFDQYLFLGVYFVFDIFFWNSFKIV